MEFNEQRCRTRVGGAPAQRSEATIGQRRGAIGETRDLDSGPRIDLCKPGEASDGERAQLGSGDAENAVMRRPAEYAFNETFLVDPAGLCAMCLVQGAPKTGINSLVDEAHEAYALAIAAGASRTSAIEAACAFYSKRRSELEAAEIRAAPAASRSGF